MNREKPTLASSSWALPLVLALSPLTACEDQGIEGSWLREEFPNGRPCVEQLLLEHGDVTSTIMCNLVDKQVGAQITGGSYHRVDDRLYVKAVRSSCPTFPKDEEIWVVSANKDTLQRTIGTTINTFTRGEKQISANRVIGCFDAELKEFDEGPVQEL